jgi:hypothetical protein
MKVLRSAFSFDAIFALGDFIFVPGFDLFELMVIFERPAQQNST